MCQQKIHVYQKIEMDKSLTVNLVLKLKNRTMNIRETFKARFFNLLWGGYQLEFKFCPHGKNMIILVEFFVIVLSFKSESVKI